MKKQYINPTMDIVAMKIESNLMAGSWGGGKGSEDLKDVGGKVGGGALGRENDFDPYWDEEDW
ncbi:MAG: hypothetical protein IJ527_09980 [Prevotella sp.]|nr:hypothetical protein [Prevotella sp.]